MTRFNKILVSVMFALAAPLASAQIEKPQATGYAGLLAGYADPTNVDGRLGYGADIGLRFPAGLTGLIYFYNSKADQDNVDLQIMHYGLGVDYSLQSMFDGFLGGLKAGVKVGMADYSAKATGIASVSESDLAYGPSVGMDYMLTQSFSLGGQADLLFVTGDHGYSTLYVLASGKYWF